MKTLDIIAAAEQKRLRTKRQPFASHYAYTRWVMHQIQQVNEFPIKATTTQGGNCVICGECGRCPGWHTEDDLEHVRIIPASNLVIGKLFDALSIAEGIVDWAVDHGSPTQPHLNLIRLTLKNAQPIVEKERIP